MSVLPCVCVNTFVQVKVMPTHTHANLRLEAGWEIVARGAFPRGVTASNAVHRLWRGGTHHPRPSPTCRVRQATQSGGRPKEPRGAENGRHRARGRGPCARTSHHTR